MESRQAHKVFRKHNLAMPPGSLEMLLLTLLALALRLLRLTEHSLWFDEAMSVHWARQGVARILQVGLSLVEDKHPPGYYLLLHGWMRVFGDGEVALRSLGALVGALAVPPVVALGRALWDRRTGLLAGLFVACCPVLIWYSQEVRMFGLATTLAAAAAWCLVQGLRRGGWAWWGGYAALMVLGCYSYLFAAFLLPGWGLLVLALAVARWRRDGLRHPWRDGAVQGLLAHGAVGAAFAPLAWRALQVGGAEASPGRPFADFAAAAPGLGTAYTVWRVPWPAGTRLAVVCAFAALALVGLAVRPPTRRAPDGRAFLAAAILGPLLVGNAFLAVDGTVFAEPRYFLMLVPFLWLAVAAGTAQLQRRARLLGALVGVAWVAVLLAAVPAMWRPENRREDWRAAAAYLEAHARPEDVVLVHPGFLQPALAYYYAGPAPVAAPFGALSSPAEVEGPLQGILTSPVVWLVQSHLEGPDPAHLVEGWLAARFPLVTEQYPAGVALKGYAAQYRLARLPQGAQPIAYAWEGLRLVGYQVDASRLRATDDRYHPPSNWLHLTTYWAQTGALPDGLRCEARLVDALGQVWGLSLARERETWNLFPPARWPPGEIIRLDQDVNLNPATPPGRYRVVVRVLGPEGTPLPLSGGGEEATLAEVDIVP
ncbi:MAG: glycosyltransferase family 39 protein [Anaerolineae bacterium]|nr:glycosyltransferase family 39 protein [Anaerolineae bacterium]